MTDVLTNHQELKHNFQGGELFSSLGPPVHSWAPFISLSIAVFQVINDRPNVLSMISCYFFQLCKIL